MTIRIRRDGPGRERVECLEGRGRVVSRLVIVERRVFLAGRPVRAAGIGGVYTEKRHRRKGLMRRVMLAALERMRARRREIIGAVATFADIAERLVNELEADW